MIGQWQEANDPGFIAGVQVGAFKGAVKNLSNSDYHLLDKYYSSSQLKYIHATSGEHFKAKYIDKKLESKEQTKQMLLGSLVHCMVITPGMFEKEFALMPDLNLRTNEGKATKEKFLMENPGKSIINDEMLKDAQCMRSAIDENEKAKDLLAFCLNEVSLFWTCPYSNLNFKARVDAMSAKHFVELKTARSASPEIFPGSAHNLDYDLSLAHYHEGIKQVLSVDATAYFVAVENELPYVVQCYKASEAMMTLGHTKWLGAVDKLSAGFKYQKWSGYFGELDEIPEISPPAWAMRNMGDIDGIP